MKMTFMPKTRAGKWAVGMGILSITLMIIVIIALKTPYFEPGTIQAIILGIFWLLILVITLIAGVIDVWKNKERSIIVFIFIFISLLSICFIILDFIAGILGMA